MSQFGSNRRRRYRYGLFGPLLVTLALSGCQEAEKAVPQEPPAPKVTVAQPIKYPVQDYLEMNGHLEAVETVLITARVKGFLEEIHFTEGVEVEEGAPLFRIDQRPYAAMFKKADADRLKAVAEAKKARSEAERAVKLAANKAISEEEMQQRYAARDSADAIVKQMDALLESAKLELSYTDIKAPIAGRISRALITKGNLVGQNESTVLTTIVSVKELFVFFDAPERDLSVISPNLPVEIGVTGEEGYPHAGKIDFRENKVDSGTGTIRLRGRIPNPMVPPSNERLLYPGLYARVRVPAGPKRDLAVIPEDALMTGQEGRYVYVLDKDNKVQKKTVTIGTYLWKGPPTKEGWRLEGPTPKDETLVTSVIAIVKGIELTDRVIVNGLTRARPGSKVAPELRAFKAPPLSDAAK